MDNPRIEELRKIIAKWGDLPPEEQDRLNEGLAVSISQAQGHFPFCAPPLRRQPDHIDDDEEDER